MQSCEVLRFPQKIRGLNNQENKDICKSQCSYLHFIYFFGRPVPISFNISENNTDKLCYRFKKWETKLLTRIGKAKTKTQRQKQLQIACPRTRDGIEDNFLAIDKLNASL